MPARTDPRHAPRRASSQGRQLSLRRLLLAGCLLVLLAAAGWLAWKWHSLHTGMPTLPEPGQLWDAKREPAVEFIDAGGRTIAVRGPRYGRAVRVTQLPDHVPQAFIAAEDKRFYLHDGADEAAIARAALSNAAAGETVSGASTITQQVVKNLVLDSRQTIRRKAQEITLARQLEKRLSKDEILTLYLNRIYFGAGLYGIDAAARHYFGKPPEQLQLHEASILAALPKAPSRLNLRTNLQGARERQAYVLGEMTDLGFITSEEAENAASAEITVADSPQYDPQLGYVLDLAVQQMRELLPVVPGDAVVTLSIDPAIQKSVQGLLRDRISRDGPGLSAGQAAALIIAADGQVIALAGGVDYEASRFNRVVQARRQPGSSFKPLVFATALEDGYGPFDVFIDQPVSIGKWQPVNYDGTYHGPMTLAEALARSTNTVAAELGAGVQAESIIALAARFGIGAPLKPYASIALGSQEVSLWELVRAYSVFQSGGVLNEPFLILKVTDSRGKVYYQHSPTRPVRVYDPDLASWMNAMLIAAVADPVGTGNRAGFGAWTVAGKTGTSQDWRDAWFIGFTSAYTGGIWIGNDDDSPMRRVTGGGLPASLWSQIMTAAHDGLQPGHLPGAERVVMAGPDARERIGFYRAMASAFVAASAGRSAPDRAPETE